MIQNTCSNHPNHRRNSIAMLYQCTNILAASFMSKHHRQFLNSKQSLLYCEIFCHLKDLLMKSRREENIVFVQNTLTTSCPANIRMAPSPAEQHSVPMHSSFYQLLPCPLIPLLPSLFLMLLLAWTLTTAITAGATSTAAQLAEGGQDRRVCAAVVIWVKEERRCFLWFSHCCEAE